MIQKAALFLDKNSIITNENLISYQQDLAGNKRRIIAALQPKNVEEVKNIVALAREENVGIYPISKGKNWGMGSKLPVEHDCVILDLSKLNKIRKVDAHFGLAVIEPGVTQQQLSEHLRSMDAPFFLDVTGSGAETSIIGNVLERGVAYHAERASQVINFEVLTGKGEIINTGFGEMKNSSVKDLYRHGIGPALDGLFFQSNFGIVISATISLLPKPEYQVSFSVALNKNENLPPAVDVFSSLIKDKVIDGIPHIFNRNRFLSLATPALYLQLKKNGEEVTSEKTETILDKMIRGQWFIGGAIMGKEKLVKTKSRALRKALKGLGRVRILKMEGGSTMTTVLKLLGMKHAVALIQAMAATQGLNQGIPTNATLKSIYWPAKKEKIDLENLEPDISEAGLKIVTVLCPMKGPSVVHLLKIIDDIAQQTALYLALSLNGISFRCLEIVISIHFLKTSTVEAEQAQNCMYDLITQLSKEGFPPIRAGIENMKFVLNPENPHWRFCESLKSVFDPDHIISPGRYNLK